MRKILAVALTDLRVTFSDRSIWVFLVVIPAVMVVVVGAANGAFTSTSTERPRQYVDVIDADNTPTSAALLDAMRAINPDLVLCNSESTEARCATDGDLTAETAAARIDDGTTAALIEIPAGLEAALQAGDPVQVVYRSAAAAGAAEAPLQALQAAVQRVGGAAIARRVGVEIAEAQLDGSTEFVEEVYRQAGDLWNESIVSVDYSETTPDEDSAAQPTGFRQSVPGIGSMYVMFTVLAGAAVLIQERKNWTLQRLITMPVTNGQLIGGKMLARFALGMLQYGVTFGIGIILALASGINFGSNPVGLVLVMAAFVTTTSALTLFLATLFKKEEQASGIVTFLALTLAPIGGAWWSLELEFIPDFMRTLSYLSPIRYAMEGFNRLIYDNASILDILPYIGALLALAAVFFALGIARFRYE